MTDEEKQESAVVSSIAAAESAMPYAMEWWDAELLPGKLRKELAAKEGKTIASMAKKQAPVAVDDTKKDDTTKEGSTPQESHPDFIERCYKHASLANSKSHALLQHPIPVLTPAQKAAAEALKNKPPTLHLTKAERKRHRKLRRAERLREQQDMQAAGLVPPPEPRLTLSNYMKVLGDQAVLDPSKMEAKVIEQVHQRKLKHERMNEERKLTKEQKAAKHARKLAEDTSTSVKVALFYVKDLAHPYHRAKVDLNAQQNGITGGVLECDRPGRGEDDKIVLVVAEGGEKAIKRYIRLMTVRMKWRGEDFYEEDDEEEEEDELMAHEDDDENGEKSKEKRKRFNPNNECELIWTGMAVKRAFQTFMFQSATNPTVARKILEAKGVAHYWDLCVGLVERKEGGGEEGMKFRLGDVGDDDEVLSS
jgi:U4/U6 small nuclear ribonucleoprotein PRP3